MKTIKWFGKDAEDAKEYITILMECEPSQREWQKSRMYISQTETKDGSFFIHLQDYQYEAIKKYADIYFKSFSLPDV